MLFLIACSGNYKDQSVENSLSEIKTYTPFALDSIFNKSWDTVYVLKPYSYREIEVFSLDIPRRYRKAFKVIEKSEGSCVLIFTKSKKMVGYSEISRLVADFSYVNSIRYPANLVFYLDRRRRAYIENEEYHQ